MGAVTTQRAAVMSIHPDYAFAIITGRKTVEFRKRRLAPDIRTVWVYATAPVQRVIGSFEIGETVSAHPNKLWSRFRTRGCISRADFASYYFGADTGVALCIDSAEALEIPIELAAILPSGVPPQSFAYIPTIPTGREPDELCLLASVSGLGQ